MSVESLAQSTEALVLAARGGDAVALDCLLTEWRPQLIRYATRFLKNEDAAQDVVQETLTKVTQNIRNLEEPKAFTSWIFTILRRDGIEYFRRERRYVHEQLSLDDERFGGEAADVHMPFAPSMEMEQCMIRMRTEDRELLSLHYWCGLELRELAQLFGIAAGAVKTRLFRARGQLRELMYLPGAG